jgi:hypothetical protein
MTQECDVVKIVFDGLNPLDRNAESVGDILRMLASGKSIRDFDVKV